MATQHRSILTAYASQALERSGRSSRLKILADAGSGRRKRQFGFDGFEGL